MSTIDPQEEQVGAGAEEAAPAPEAAPEAPAEGAPEPAPEAA